jgi:hypothetical protein
LSKKQLNFSVLVRCITIFNDKFINIQKEKDLNTIKSYIDFVNEELFYFESKYIPKKVALEWIDGMIEIIPIYDTDNSIINTSNCNIIIHEKNILYSFQRIKNAFKIKKEYNFELIYSNYETESNYTKRKKERKKLLKEIYKNIK